MEGAGSAVSGERADTLSTAVVCSGVRSGGPHSPASRGSTRPPVTAQNTTGTTRMFSG